MADVKLRNVVKEFGDTRVVDNVSLHIENKEFLVLVGPSGCGKSTTLRMVAGLEDVTDGEIFIGERLVNDVAPKDRDIAMVFQNYALYPHMNVFDNMAFGLKLRKVPRGEIQRRVRDAADTLGLIDLLQRKPGQLSGGQRQRVALGRAIVREPQVFLMDEPLSNLDAKLRVQMRAELAKLHRRLETTVIYVTHDQTEAMTMGQRIVVMKDGRVQQVADPYTIYHYPANRFVASFIGSPAMSFLKLAVTDVDGSIRLQGQGVDVRLPDSKVSVVREYIGRVVEVGLRPEDLHVVQEVEGGDDSSLRAPIDVIEPMGAETFLYLSVAGTNLTVRMSPEISLRSGEVVQIGLNLEKCHIFDGDTGEALVNSLRRSVSAEGTVAI